MGEDAGDNAVVAPEAPGVATEETKETATEAEKQGSHWGCFSLDRKSRFVVAFNAGASEEEAAPQVVRQTRERTAGRRGVVWISDGSGSYEKWIRRVYRDPVHTGGPGRPRLERTPGPPSPKNPWGRGRTAGRIRS